MRRFFLVFFLCVTASASSWAAETFECKYTNFINPEGNHKEEMNLTFLVDDSNDKAYLIGNIGTSEVMHVNGSDGRGFIEITATGNIMTTSIDSAMNSVHSRHSIFDKLMPSQYYGRCIKK